MSITRTNYALRDGTVLSIDEHENRGPAKRAVAAAHPDGRVTILGAVTLLDDGAPLFIPTSLRRLSAEVLRGVGELIRHAYGLAQPAASEDQVRAAAAAAGVEVPSEPGSSESVRVDLSHDQAVTLSNMGVFTLDKSEYRAVQVGSCDVSPALASQWRNGDHWHVLWPDGSSWCYETAMDAGLRVMELRYLRADAARASGSDHVPAPLPVVAHKGPHDTDASLLRLAARNLRNGYDVGGSNVSRAVAELIERAVAGSGEFARVYLHQWDESSAVAACERVRALVANARSHAGGSYTAQVDALSLERALDGAGGRA